MMRKLLIVFFVLISISIGGNSFARSFSNEPDGFRGISWGTKISDLKDMTFVKSEDGLGGIKIYSRRSDDLIIGGAKLKSIEYAFWNDRLFQVKILFDGYGNFSALKDATFEKFGNGHKANRFIEDYVWFGDVTFISIEYREIKGKGVLYFWSQNIMNEIKDYQQQQAQKGAEKGF